MALKGRMERLRKRLPAKGEPQEVVCYDPETGECLWAVLIFGDRKTSVGVDPALVTEAIQAGKPVVDGLLIGCLPAGMFDRAPEA
jgi:hypothetical protein